MQYNHTVEGKFLSRPNRFVALVEIDGKEETVHVKNTGRCKELLLPESRVILEYCNHPNRKTKYDLIAVYKQNLGWVNIDSQLPNKVVKEWLESAPDLFSNITYLKPEYVYGQSRLDFYLECGERKIFIEVKGCTLEIESMGYFPDAPTERGVKHLRELTKAQQEGYECYIAFAITMPKVTHVLPNVETHAEFGTALEEAKNHGVKILYLPCHTEPNQVEIMDYNIE